MWQWNLQICISLIWNQISNRIDTDREIEPSYVESNTERNVVIFKAFLLIGAQKLLDWEKTVLLVRNNDIGQWFGITLCSNEVQKQQEALEHFREVIAHPVS